MSFVAHTQEARSQAAAADAEHAASASQTRRAHVRISVLEQELEECSVRVV